MKQIRKIVHEKQKEIDKVVKRLCKKSGENPEKYKGFITKTVCGKARKDGRLTVPLWAFRKKLEGYFTYYVAHEMAHVHSLKKLKKFGHNAEFYESFKLLCPKKYQHYELDYKPSCAKYGIKKK